MTSTSDDEDGTSASDEAGEPQITALSGCVIIMVLYASYTGKFHTTVGHTRELAVAPVGFLALQLFLAITGYRLFQDLRGASWRDYVRGRLMRFLPIVPISVLIAYSLIQVAGIPALRADTVALPANLVILADMVGASEIDSAHWRLKIEVILSVLAGLVWFGAGRGRLRAALMAGLLVDAFLVNGEPARESVLSLSGVLTLDGYLPQVAFGVALLHIRQHRRVPLWWLIGTVAAALTFLSNPPSHGLVVLAAFAALAAAAWGQLEQLGRLGWLLWLGRFAFPIYVVHQIIGFVLIYWLERQGADPVVAIMAACAMAVAVAWCINEACVRSQAVASSGVMLPGVARLPSLFARGAGRAALASRQSS